MTTLVISDVRTFEMYRRNHPEKKCKFASQPNDLNGWNASDIEIVDLSNMAMPRRASEFWDKLALLKSKLNL